MNCKGCQYPLWNLVDRRCPECGLAFYPSQFEFVPRSVRFLCPFCKQQYFGTDAHGHLVPRAFGCVSCNTRISMDEMILLPAEGVAEEITKLDRNPWIDSTVTGFYRRWFRTLGRSIVAPSRLILSTPDDSSAMKSFMFAGRNVLASWFLGVLSIAAIGLVPLLSAPGAVYAVPIWLLMIVVALALPFALLLSWTLLTHLLLHITGGAPGGIRRTKQCMWYSSGPFVFAAIPCLGAYVAIPAVIWWSIGASIMLAKGHGINGFRATLAAITPVLVLVGAFVALLILAISSVSTMVATAAARAGTVQTAMLQIHASSIQNALTAYAGAKGAYPAHAAELLSTGSVAPSDFCLSSNPTAADAMPLGTTTLGQFSFAQPSQQQQVIAQVIAALPSNTIAHRLGDYVFTYHGINANSADPGLWIFIAESPDPALPLRPPSPTNTGPSSSTVAIDNGRAPPPSAFFVGSVGGSVRTISKAAFGQALARQNAFRATFNLPPLPDPTTVTESKPAAGPVKSGF